MQFAAHVTDAVVDHAGLVVGWEQRKLSSLRRSRSYSLGSISLLLQQRKLDSLRYSRARQ